MWIWALMLVTNMSATGQSVTVEKPPVFLDGLDHIGGYIPNSQVLIWCTSNDIAEIRSCDGFINGVVNTAGMIDVEFPRGPIDTGGDYYAQKFIDIRNTVVSYLNSLPNRRMSSPAARSVYDALVAKYPYTGPHKQDIPYRPTGDHDRR